jgi:hypothetical protein
MYAINVDKCFTEETWLAVKDSQYKETYKDFFNQINKDKII